MSDRSDEPSRESKKDDKDEKDKDKRDKDKKKVKRPKERTKSSRHEVTIGDEKIEYTATAGTLFLKKPDGEPRASVFYVAYQKHGVKDPARRPITFAFNGGPGSSAVWLHLGTLGPRRADATDAGPSRSDVRLIDNPDSILDVTDLVFIDPVGTGYSKPLGDSKVNEFTSVEDDAKAVGEFIRRFTSRTNRWASPRFVAGESYGTTRAAALTAHLAQEGVMVDGAVLISAALMFQTFIFEVGNDLPYVLYLPGYAATAAYHKALPRPVEDVGAFLRDVERFALDEYGPALARGSSLPEARRQEIATRLHELTGVASKVWLERDLRIELPTFCRELLRDRGVIVGRLDSRFTGLASRPDDDPHNDDPALFYPYGPYTSLMHDYLQRELAYEEEEPYNIFNFKVNESWKWNEEKGPRMGYVNAAVDLRRAMVQNPHLRVFFANGIYDLATPYFASMHTARHLGREASIRDQISEAFYDAGHMMYLHEASRRKLREDLVRFYTSTR
ncbi:MAG: S10 family peptidase [Sandaracinaceae bacterium]